MKRAFLPINVIKRLWSLPFGVVVFILLFIDKQGLSAVEGLHSEQLALTFFDLGWKGFFTISLFFLTFGALLLELMPPFLIMLISALILVFTTIVSPADFLLGFSEDIIFSIAALCIVVKAVELSGILSFISKNVLSRSKNSFLQLLSIMLPVGVSSAFMNNTPIVLLMTSVVRQWALDRKKTPSKFLIPLSYAAIFGGVCTLIGASSNLIVDGLMRYQNPRAGLSFFELAKIGLPVAFVGLIYTLTLGYYLLPVRKDPTTALVEQTPEFTGEFLVDEECELIGKTIEEAGRRFFRDELLIEIEREGRKIDSPSGRDILVRGDRLVFAGDMQHMAELHAIKGLRSLADPHFHLDVSSPHFSEVVISVASSFIGKNAKQIDFRNNYGATVVAIYRQGKRLVGNVSNIILRPGDTLMLLSKEPWDPQKNVADDFFYIRQNERLSLFSPWRFAVIITLLIVMIGSVMMGVPLVVASLAAASFLLITGSVSLRHAKSSVSWGLLILIASSFALGTALQKTGVAVFFAQQILQYVGSNPHLLIGVIFVVTMLITSLITNNAAVLLLFPIAIKTAYFAGFDSVNAIKAVGIAVTLAASCSFATPIGYQTNMIVYGPGGYRFSDYIKVGVPLSLLVIIVCVILIPYFWPLA